MTGKMALTPKQAAALAALLAGRTATEAARAAGCSLRTLARWKAEPFFVAELRAGEAELIGAALRGLSVLARPAADTLGRVLADDGAPVGVKLRAAQIVLDSLLRLREAVDLEARVAALEEGQGHDGTASATT